MEPSAPELNDAVPVVFGRVPNIQGAVTLYKASGGDGVTGAFSRNTSGSISIYYDTIQAQDQYSAEVYLNAGKSNSLYSGSKHQSSALQVLPCIRC